MICVAVTYTIRAGHEDEAAALFLALIPPTRSEPGCHMYLVHRSPTDPLKFFLYEQYADQAALDAHRASPHFQTHAANGLFNILDNRSPEIYELLGE